MAATASPRRAEHLGSLLRPKELIQLAYSLDTKARYAVEDREIVSIVREQQNLGFRAITDGEYRRTLFWGTFFNGLEGFSELQFDAERLRTYLPHIRSFVETGFKPPAVVCTGKIRHTGRSSQLEEFCALRDLIGAEHAGDIKLTIPAPNWYHLQYRHGQAFASDVYASDAEYFADLAAAYRKELQLLYAEGLRRVQIDDPCLSYFCSPDVLEGWAADSLNVQTPDELFQAYVAWYNDCFRDVPTDMVLGMHICRGNYTDGRYWAQGGFDRITRTLFRDSVLRVFYLEYDSPRAGGFELLRDLPLDKFVVLGVVTTKSAALEDRAALEARVREAARFVAEGNGVSETEALQQLCVSPQCGFASHSGEDRMTREDMLAKLRLVVDLAQSLWPGQT